MTFPVSRSRTHPQFSSSSTQTRFIRLSSRLFTCPPMGCGSPLWCIFLRVCLNEPCASFFRKWVSVTALFYFQVCFLFLQLLIMGNVTERKNHNMCETSERRRLWWSKHVAPSKKNKKRRERERSVFNRLRGVNDGKRDYFVMCCFMGEFLEICLPFGMRRNLFC